MHDAERAADYLERLLAFDPLALSSARHADVQRAAAALEAARLALLTASTVDPSTKTGA